MPTAYFLGKYSDWCACVSLLHVKLKPEEFWIQIGKKLAKMTG